MHYFYSFIYKVFCYLLSVHWVNNVTFHDLGAKYGQRTKIVQKEQKQHQGQNGHFTPKMKDHIS